MKMTIVSAFNITHTPTFQSSSKPELEGKTGKSYADIFSHLIEGDSVTVEFTGKGYKNFSIKNGQHYVQRNFVHDY